MLSGESSIIVRHADKGEWQIDEAEIRRVLPAEESNLVLTVLKNEFPAMEKTPLRLDGLARSIRLGDELFERLPERTVLVSINSGKDRARLTNALTTARIAQRETQYNNTHSDDKRQIDILQVEAEEITSLLADTDDITWPPYAEMIRKDGISEFEAIARWLNDMNSASSSEIEGHPREAAERYRKLITDIREKITSDKVPVVLFGVGHSGSLGQVVYENTAQSVTAEDVPNFCEMFTFSSDGKMLDRNKVSL